MEFTKDKDYSPIKKLKIIPDNIDKYIEDVNNLDIQDKIKDFLIKYLDTEIGEVNDENNFYIDYPYKYNFYNYSKKQDTRFMIDAFKMGYKEKELNYLNYENNFINADGSEYLKLKNKVGYDEYYPYVCSKFESYTHLDNKLFVKRYISTKLNDLIFDEKVQLKFIEFIKELYHKGLWLNDFNNYSIRYNPSCEEFYVYDPDTFYILAHNKDLCGIKNEQEFISAYKKYKLREKSIILKLKDCLDKDSAEYIYYSYWFLENISQQMINKEIK